MTTPDEYIAAAERHKGKKYVFGAKGPNEFDCSGLVTDAGVTVGVWMPDGSKNQIAYCDPIPVKEAENVPGALLYMPGHIAISKGGGKTIEARSPENGIGNFSTQGRGFTKAGLIPGITYPGYPRKEKEPTMISPVKGYVSSNFGRRTINGKVVSHSGIDIATGKVGVPVYAPFAGTVSNVVSSRVHDLSAAQTKNAGKARVANWLSGNGCRVNNPDGETQAFCHIRPVVKNGQKVAKGQLLGHIDLSGNTTGPHLHLETWNSKGTIQNPRIWFNAHKVVPGSAPKLPPVASKPVQTNKKTHLPLVVDGVEGAYTITESQRALKKSGDYKGVIEEDSGGKPVRGSYLKMGFQRFYKRKGFYKGSIDGNFASASITSEQRALKKAGYYKGVIEADKRRKPVRGPEQIKAVQRALNAGYYK